MQNINSTNQGDWRLGCLIFPIALIVVVYALFGVFDAYLIIPSRDGNETIVEGQWARWGGAGFLVFYATFIYALHRNSDDGSWMIKLGVSCLVCGLLFYGFCKVFLQ